MNMEVVDRTDSEGSGGNVEIAHGNRVRVTRCLCFEAQMHFVKNETLRPTSLTVVCSGLRPLFRY